ncbi:MAG: hypothetical protein J7521_10525 [Caulobacter sp.]|nr:hypothetical protein [Caulobacter sp.]
MSKPALLALSLALCAVACSKPQSQGVPLTGQVKAVVDRSKSTTATYAMYSWNDIIRDGAPAQEWGAEFHSGDFHRVETQHDRLVADCVANTGVARNVDTGQVYRGPQIARAACGINTNKPFLEAQSLGAVQTPFGPADRVRLVDPDNVRTYDISPQGVILASTFEGKGSAKARAWSLKARAVAVLDALPDPEMFDEASLEKSYVPDRFKVAP